VTDGRSAHTGGSAIGVFAIISRWQAGRMTFDELWGQLDPIGRATTGGYRRLAWTDADSTLREWFTATCVSIGLDVVLDRAGNQWAWWGDPDAASAAGRPGIVAGSHLDSVPDGGAFDGPLGVVCALLAVDALRREGLRPTRPIGVVNFVDEEGARFGIACAGSRLITGALATDRALALRDVDGLTMAQALTAAGRTPGELGRDPETLARVGCFVELHVEQGVGLAELGAPIALASSIWPHGRWRAELPGQANHAGTTRLVDRQDPMLGYARLVLAARAAAGAHGAVATCGKVAVLPNGVNAIASLVTGWVDARGPVADEVRAVVAELASVTQAEGGAWAEESWTDETVFDAALRAELSTVLGAVPVLATGAGHDAGILANAGIPSAMVFVRNPSGISHSPVEFAERDDCLAGVQALTSILRSLAA
jgi:N-carbamoyl-L-amino-acid hydrolase